MIRRIAELVPLISDGAYVDSLALLSGAVEIKEQCSIFPFAVIRGDNMQITVEMGTNVQEHVMLHTDVAIVMHIGAHCTIGHRAILHGCVLEDHVLVGMGSIIMNGSHIGHHSIIGAGSLVIQNTHFPPYSLIVGSPAKLVRQLTEQEKAGIHASAEAYIARGKEQCSDGESKRL